MVSLIILTGIYFTVRTKGLQLLKVKLIYKNTIGNIKSGKESDKKSISQFQALTTALAATIGTGSIAGVATALSIGGAGSLFWMWVCALFGMMTVYAENVLGIYFRKKNGKGEFVGGAMYYIEYGLKCKWLAVLFSIFCLLASFGMGNMAQGNTISTALYEGLAIDVRVTGLIFTIITAIIIIGGIKRIGKFAERLIPFMFVVFVISSIVVLWINYEKLPLIFDEIFKSAFGFQAVGGGISGIMIKNALSTGVKRGVFSNEAGLGSSVIAHSCAKVKEPVVQGMWGILEVFIDTIAICTLTALVVLVTGENQVGNFDGTTTIIRAFSKDLGLYGEIFSTVSVIVFAFATLIGWSFFGEKAFEYLFGERFIFLYRIFFVIAVYLGSVLNLTLVWEISDLFNGLMAIPNLISLWFLSGVVFSVTSNYFQRQKGINSKKMLSFFHKT